MDKCMEMTLGEYMGYIMRYGGGLFIAVTALRTSTDTMLPEEFIGGILAGGMLYLIGDRMGQREIAKRQLYLDEELLEVQKKQVSLLERIASHDAVQSDLSDRK